MDDNLMGETDPLPPHLRFLRLLVTVLTAVMIVGVLTIIALLVIRISDNRQPVLVHPDVFELPQGVETLSYSVVNGYTVLFGDDNIIRVFASDTHDLVNTLDLNN